MAVFISLLLVLTSSQQILNLVSELIPYFVFIQPQIRQSVVFREGIDKCLCTLGLNLVVTKIQTLECIVFLEGLGKCNRTLP